MLAHERHVYFFLVLQNTAMHTDPACLDGALSNVELFCNNRYDSFGLACGSGTGRLNVFLRHAADVFRAERHGVRAIVADRKKPCGDFQYSRVTYLNSHWLIRIAWDRIQQEAS
jgi:hypothetical protein